MAILWRRSLGNNDVVQAVHNKLKLSKSRIGVLAGVLTGSFPLLIIGQAIIPIFISLGVLTRSNLNGDLISRGPAVAGGRLSLWNIFIYTSRTGFLPCFGLHKVHLRIFLPIIGAIS